MILPVIVRAPRQWLEVERLVRHCLDMDGTQLRVIDADAAATEAVAARLQGNPRLGDTLIAHALHHAATVVGRQPFFWLEPSSIPMHPGWLKRLTKQYQKAGKPFLFSADTGCRIGIYDPETAWLVPTEFAAGMGVAQWLETHFAPWITRTPLIQHSPGSSNGNGSTVPHRFPREHNIIRPDALVFHADDYQDLLRDALVDKPLCFLHTGHMGDIIASLPVIRQLGGGDLLITHDDFVPEMRFRYPIIEPLLARQPYVRRVEWTDAPEGVNRSFAAFRKFYKPTHSLTTSQALWLGLAQVDMSPWLQADAWPGSRGKIVIHRSPRYHNAAFPWEKLLRKYGRQCLFVGPRDEWASFTLAAGCPVQRVHTDNLWHTARVIAGAELFIGNQSSPCWIAMGLGKNLIQETHPTINDSIIDRPNARFCKHGEHQFFKDMGYPL